MTTNQTASQAQPAVKIEGIFVRQSTLVSTITPFEAKQNSIEYQIHIQSGFRSIDNTDAYAVALSVKLEGRHDAKDETPLLAGEFAVELVANLDNLPTDAIDEALGAFLPNQLVPFMAELIHSASSRTGFGPITFPPVVFGIDPKTKETVPLNFPQANQPAATPALASPAPNVH